METRGKFLLGASVVALATIGLVFGVATMEKNPHFVGQEVYATSPYIYESSSFIPRAIYNGTTHYLVYDVNDSRFEEGSQDNFTPVTLKWLTTSTFHIYLNNTKACASTASKSNNKFIASGYDTWQVFSDGIWALNDGQKSIRRLGYNPNNGNAIGAPYVNTSYQPLYFYTAEEKTDAQATWHCNWSDIVESCLDNLIISNH